MFCILWRQWHRNQLLLKIISKDRQTRLLMLIKNIYICHTTISLLHKFSIGKNLKYPSRLTKATVDQSILHRKFEHFQCPKRIISWLTAFVINTWWNSICRFLFAMSNVRLLHNHTEFQNRNQPAKPTPAPNNLEMGIN